MTLTTVTQATDIFAVARQAYAAHVEAYNRERAQHERDEADARQRAKREHAGNLQAALKEKLDLDVVIEPDDLIGDEYYSNQIKLMRFNLYPMLTVGFSNLRNSQGELSGFIDGRQFALRTLVDLGMLLETADEVKAKAIDAKRIVHVEQQESEQEAPPPPRPELNNPEALIYNTDCGVHVALDTEHITLRAFVLDTRNFASRLGDGLTMTFEPPEAERLLTVLRDGGLATFSQGRFVQVDGHIMLLYKAGDVIKLALGQHKANLVASVERWVTEWWPQYCDWHEAARGYRPWAEEA